jgi:hypothetical protein
MKSGISGLLQPNDAPPVHDRVLEVYARHRKAVRFRSIILHTRTVSDFVAVEVLF